MQETHSTKQATDQFADQKQPQVDGVNIDEASGPSFQADPSLTTYHVQCDIEDLGVFAHKAVCVHCSYKWITVYVPKQCPSCNHQFTSRIAKYDGTAKQPNDTWLGKTSALTLTTNIVSFGRSYVPTPESTFVVPESGGTSGFLTPPPGLYLVDCTAVLATANTNVSTTLTTRKNGSVILNSLFESFDAPSGTTATKTAIPQLFRFNGTDTFQLSVSQNFSGTCLATLYLRLLKIGSPVTQVEVVGFAQQEQPFWVSYMSPDEPVISFGSTEMAARRHNKMQHALNGNMSRWLGTATVEKSIFELPPTVQQQLDHMRTLYPDAFTELDAQAAAAKDQTWEEAEEKLSDEEKEYVIERANRDILPPTTGGKDQKALVHICNRICQRSSLVWFEGRLVVHMNPKLASALDDPLPLDTVEVETPPALLHDRPPKTEDREKKGKKPSKTVDWETQKRINQQQYKAVVERISKKFSSNVTALPLWYANGVSKQLAMEVTANIWGPNWMEKDEMNSAEWYMYCKMKGVSDDLCTLRLLETTNDWQALSDDEKQATWNVYMRDDYFVTLKVLEAEANAHNKKVHALNGNTTSLARTMTDVDGRPSMDSFYSGGYVQSAPSLKGSALTLALATQASSTNPTQQNNLTATILRGDIVASNNTVTQDRCLYLPVTSLIPRQVRPAAGGAAVNATLRLPSKTILPTPFSNNTLTDTDLAKVITQAAIQATQNLGRADNTTLGGFNAIDVAFYTRLRAAYGLSMDVCLAKIAALHDILSWRYPGGVLPMLEVSAIDQNTIPDATQNPVITANFSPIFGEDCGGANAVLPFYGVPGNVFFHLTLETVPISQKPNAIFVPAQILNMDQQMDAGEALALFVVMWAPFPFCMYNVTAATFDVNGANGAAQTFAHLSSLLNIPGPTELHFVLPRRTTAVNPTDQASANNRVLQQPISGPLPSAGIGANQLLGVSFVGAGGLVPHNLAQYLYTWSEAFDCTSIANFIQQLSYFVAVEEPFARVRDILSHTTRAIPCMPTDLAGTTTRYAPNNIAQSKYCNAASIRFVPTVNDWPQDQSRRADYVMNQTDPIAWNKVMLGLAVCSEPATLSYVMPEWIGNSSSALWTSSYAFAFFMAWTSHYSDIGWSAGTWDNAYTNNTMNSFREIIRMYYAIVSQENKAQQRVGAGAMLNDHFYKMFGARLGASASGCTVFDCMCPPTGTRVTTINAVGADVAGVIPVLVADVWMQSMTKGVPRWQTSFPTPLGADSTKGYSNGLLIVRLPGNAVIGTFIMPKYYRPALQGNETADFTDDHRWNERLAYVNSGATTSFMTGAAFPQALPANVTPYQRQPINIPGQPLQATSLHSHNTMCWPTCDDTGQILFAIAPAAQMATTNNACARIAALSLPCWQLSNVFANTNLLLESSTQSVSKWTSFRTKETEVPKGSVPSEQVKEPSPSPTVTGLGETTA